MRVVYVFFVLTVYCSFLLLHYQHCLKFKLGKNKADNPEHILPAWVAIQNTGFAS